MLDEERTLLRDVSATPASDVPRLAYADWLLSQGRGWGEFIKAAIAAGPSPSAPAAKALAKHLRLHSKDGLGAAYPFTKRDLWAFSRGFPTQLSTNAAALVKCAEEVGLRAPGATLHLARVLEKHIDALAPHTRGFQGGELHVGDLKDRGMKRLCDSGMLSGFGDVKLFGAELHADGVAALAACGSAGTVRRLSIDLRLELAPLFASTALTGLIELTIHSTRLTEGLRDNRRTLSLLKVGGLDDFDDDDARLLARSPGGGSLSMLSLSRNPIATEGPTGLTRQGLLDMIAGLPNLSGLWLYGFKMNEDLAAEITAALAPPHNRFYWG